MVRRQVHIHGSDGIVRAHQLQLLIPGQIAEIEQAEISEGDERSERARVLGRISVTLRTGRTERIGLSGAWERILNVLARRGQNLNLDVLDGDRIARLYNQVLY